MTWSSARVNLTGKELHGMIGAMQDCVVRACLDILSASY